MRCMNEKCNKNPFDSPNMMVFSIDGDMCCNQQCYDEARKQMDYFCSTILPDDEKFAEWLEGS